MKEKDFLHFGRFHQKLWPKLAVIHSKTRWHFQPRKKTMFFPSFPFSKKSGLFFARLVARNFTRALGTPSARLRMGRATRAALNAGRWQRGQLSTQMAVKGGGHYRQQPSVKEADKNILFHAPTMTDIRLWMRVSHQWALIMMLGCLEVKKEKQHSHAWAVIPVVWLAG